MSAQTTKFFVVGLTHIDLAWKKTREEHREIMEAAVARLLDVLDRYPDYTYVIEQAGHYRALAGRRPDLIARLRSYLQAGRLEFAGGLASTLETNGPSGESFVRNQLLGLRCIEDLFGVSPRTGYLIDTFGINAQVPQILSQFGFSTLLANRFGGNLDKDVFRAQGLDGSTLLVAGRDVGSPYVKPEHVFFRMTEDYDAITALFERAAANASAGPCLVMPYTEYDGIASTHIAKLVADKNAAPSANPWVFSALGDFFDALAEHEAGIPEIGSDLNPEFTGTFGLRPAVRCGHREAENLLLEAEKWAALLGLRGWQGEASEAWWKLAFVQSHDVYSGSHPTSVFEDTMVHLSDVDRWARSLLEQCANSVVSSESPSSEVAFLAMSGLPWERDAVVGVPLPTTIEPSTIAGVQSEGEELPFDLHDGMLSFRTSFSGIAAKHIALTIAEPAQEGTARKTTLSPEVDLTSSQKQVTIKHQNMIVSADSERGLQLEAIDQHGRAMQSIGIDLVVQEDKGNFQIENLVTAEVSSLSGSVAVEGPYQSALRERVIVRGKFPPLQAAAESPLDWEIECSAYPGLPRVDVVVRLNWRGQASRVRLKVATGLGSSTGIFEIPFGAVRRYPYHSRKTARGEWPVHRWVAVEEGGRGVALVNRGHVGAEVAGGTIWQTLLRAPVDQYVGMVPDETSAQHGSHTFQFSVVPYEGSWTNGECAKAGQDVNSPVVVVPMPASIAPLGEPILTMMPNTVVLSCVKLPEDETPDELIVRVYETVGQNTATTLNLRGASGAWHSDLRETRMSPLDCSAGRVSFDLGPFEIKTLRIRRDLEPE